MRLGLLTDIHEHVENLRAALTRFNDEQVDQIVVIGDLFETGVRIEETCRLLAEAGAIGVWGNHDFGLCFEPSQEICARYPAAAIAFMTSLKPRLEVEGCLFTHVEPWLNPESVSDLWYVDGPPSDSSKLARIFNAVPNRLMFAGHYHQWFLATPAEVTEWTGGHKIRLDQGRYFVVVGGLYEGHFAMLDTTTSELVPLHTQ